MFISVFFSAIEMAHDYFVEEFLKKLSVLSITHMCRQEPYIHIFNKISETAKDRLNTKKALRLISN